MYRLADVMGLFLKKESWARSGTRHFWIKRRQIFGFTQYLQNRKGYCNRALQPSPLRFMVCTNKEHNDIHSDVRACGPKLSSFSRYKPMKVHWLQGTYAHLQQRRMGPRSSLFLLDLEPAPWIWEVGGWGKWTQIQILLFKPISDANISLCRLIS